ncbi:hypothetical protein [Methanobacterium sp.]|uniref:hypothetical protein n=1 Tax=Methanobacterium sp. TaxID=2164 RepID=UPI003158EEE7
MEKYKVSSAGNNELFLITDCYKKLCQIMKGLKNDRGKIVHVIGAPGTGKSANIYHAIGDLNLNIYDMKLRLKSVNVSSKHVFNTMFEGISEDLEVKSKEEIYRKLSEYDAVLIADNFHDSHNLDSNYIGFSKWTYYSGFKALYFYLLCITEYLRHRKYFKNINIILQTAWRIHIMGKKYDLFSDLGLFSKILVNILNIFFDVVVICYSEKETIEIVKMHVKDADTDTVREYIHKYGHKPRFICDALKK